MGRMRAGARRAAVGQVVGGKKIGFGGIVENIVAGVDAGMEMRVDKSRRDQTAFGIDLLVHRSRSPSRLGSMFSLRAFQRCPISPKITYPRVPLETRSFPIAGQMNCRKDPPLFF